MSRSYPDPSLQVVGSVAVSEVEVRPRDTFAESGALRWDAEAAIAALLDGVPCGIVLVGPGGELRAVNGHFAESLGHTQAELMELGFFERLIERVATAFADPRGMALRWRERREAGVACWDELELLLPQRKRLERFAGPVVNARGRCTGWMEVYRDVTGQKLIEGNLFHIERMVTLGQLVSSVAHDLNNPLTSILGYAQLLSRRYGDGQVEVEHILQEADRAGRIARSVLQFGRDAKPDRAAVDLNDIVRSILALRARELDIEGIAISLELEPGLPPVLGDASQLQQVLLNLILNSEQAIVQAAGSGSIRLCTRHVRGDRVAVEVIDDGPGIAAQALPRIFDPFFTTKPVGVGTGLGLSIAYGIAHDHGGTVSVESSPGCGATFTVELPVAPAPPLAARALSRRAMCESQATTGMALAAAMPIRSERILVIEDEPVVARLIAEVLVEEGHRCEVVLDSREGLTMLAKESYGLVLCDLRMPHLSGRALFQELQRRAHPLRRRFVFVTGDTLSPSTAHFLKTSGVPYLAKPFLIDELKSVVHAALRDADATLPAAPPRVQVRLGRTGQKGARAR